MENKAKIELKLPVLPDMELIATQTAEIVSRHMGLSEEKSAEMGMALIEACINAFEHSLSNKTVFIHFIIDEESLTIKVIDQGVGFDHSKVEVPKIENKLGANRKRGWGIQLIRELVDSVEFESTSEGTTVTMVKKKSV